MAQERIEIQFRPEGDKELILAIKQLDIVTKRLKGTTSKYEKELKDLGRVQDKFNISTILGTKSLRNMGGATLGLTRIISRFRSKLLLASFALGGFNMLVRQRVEEYRNQLQAEQALVNNLANVENAAKNGAQGLIEYASALQSVTAFGDEQIIQAASQLATYQLNEKAIQAILPRLLDMTSSTGTLEGNTIALGKAFTGQIGSLSRYGVIIDKARLEIARSKGAHEEFNFIIGELDKNYQGLARTLAETPIGQLDQLENEIGDLNEELGRLGLPFLKQWTNLKKDLTEAATWIALVMEELQKRSGDSWVMGLLDSVLIFADLGSVLEKVNKRFEEHKQKIIDSTNAAATNNNMVKTSAEIIAKYNKELAFNISSIQLTASQTEGLTDVEAKQLIIKEKIAANQRLYNEGLIEEQDFIIKQNALIIEQSSLEQQLHEQKISNAFELAETITNFANQRASQVREAADSELGIISEQQQKEMDLLKNRVNYQRASARQQDIMEQEIVKKHEKREKEVRDKANKRLLMAFRADQALSIAKTIMNTSEAAMKAMGQTGIFGFPMASIIKAMGAMEVAMIASQSPPKMAQGGLVGGRRHSQGGTMIEAERGEYVVSRRGVDAIGLEALNRINAGAGGGSINVSFSGNVLSKDFLEDEAIPQIKEALRRGGDIGVG
tara:strand:+ start:1177 stop:3186 length:2010 start_codon:yes stop_codon:yes gene_type:complete